jgi:hypothetical protein
MTTTREFREKYFNLSFLAKNELQFKIKSFISALCKHIQYFHSVHSLGYDKNL